jgi:hypothetical protein
LEWWANRSTCLGSAEITIVVTALEDGWDARGWLSEVEDEARESFSFLHQVDPMFTLRFADDSVFDVIVGNSDGTGKFDIAEAD